MELTEMMMVLIGTCRKKVGGNLNGRMVVAARVVALLGGTSGGVTNGDGGALTNCIGRVGLSWIQCSVECKASGLRLPFLRMGENWL
jgi:hypothetical protein